MTDKQSLFKRFIEDLKRRHVVRIAVGYIIVSWVVLQVVDVLLPAFDVGDWVFRAFLTVAFIGFFVTVILAWVFDISRKHIVKTKGRVLPRWAKSLISIPLIVLVGLGGWWVWAGYVTHKESLLRPTELTELPIVAVMPFRNMTGNPDNDWFSEGLANLVRDNLTRSKYLRVVSSQKLRSIIGDATDVGVISELSEEKGIGFILGGEMLITPGGISVTSRLSDTVGGIDLSARQTENLTVETLLSAAGPIAAQVKQGLNVPRTEQIDIFAADFVTRNLSAYESYVAGLGFFLNYQYKQAEQAFNAALQLAPDFAVARYRLAYIQAVNGNTELAVINAQKALETGPLAEREQLYIEAALALFSHDYETATNKYESLLQEYPFELEAREMLAKSYWGQYRQDEAVRVIEQLAAEEPQNKVIWNTLGWYLLVMGEFERAQPALKRYADLAPDDASSYLLLGDSLRYQGDYAGARAQYARALEINPAMREVGASLATIEYMEGDFDQAAAEFQAIVENENLVVRERLDAMFPLVSLLAASGDFSAAIDLLERFASGLKEEQIREAMASSMQALLQLELGREAAAMELVSSAIQLSPGVPTRYLFARGLIELKTRQFEQVEATAKEITGHALPPENPDRTEEKAAAFLNGMAMLAQGQTDKARTQLEHARELGGYAYAIYELGLARALLQQGNTAAALALVQESTSPDLVEPRLDLEPERVRLILLSAEIQRAAGDISGAGQNAMAFLERFSQAPPTHHATMLGLEIAAEAGLVSAEKQAGKKQKDDQLAVLSILR